MRARIPLPEIETLSPEQRTIYDSILKSRGNVAGPFLAWLQSPGLANPAEKLGAYCRYGTSLSRIEVELLILVTAAHHACEGEWRIHAPIAIEAGLAPGVVEAIRSGGPPDLADERLAALAAFAAALLKTNRVDDATFQAAADQVGLPTLVEAVGVVGYYGLVAHTLNAFEMGVD
jgi:4-carboxymuconolactone decarboxylase